MEALPLDPRDLLSHADGMRRVALRLLRDEADADDVVQEALAKAVQNPPRDGAPLRPWLAVVTRNLAIDLMRSGGRRRAREQAQGGGALEWPTPDQLVERTEAHRRAVDALLGLPEPYRQTLILRFLHDLGAAEIARRRGSQEATVRSQVKRGLDMLRRELGSADGDWRASCLLILRPLPAPSPQPWGPLLLSLALSLALVGWVAMTAPIYRAGPERQQPVLSKDLQRELRGLGYVEDADAEDLQNLGYVGGDEE
ncbi:MAG: RNA polymerase sigma factor [Planctomycetes bacterium]|nr:RNA polymerase sigma factor [Planctomycetota bacterium]MBL7007867.1 RNA polymerase sigma factor [Planctomycetota bacterium]